MASYLVYEQPLNERIRTFLRLETLIKRLKFYSKQNNEWCAYNALLLILEVTALLERVDIKQESIKELERQQTILKDLSNMEGVNKEALTQILNKLFYATQNVHQISGKLGEHIKQIDFLLALKQRATIPGGTCDFDLPELHHWLGKKSKDRIHDINSWAEPYLLIYDAIELLLKVIRDSGHSSSVVAKGGFYQESLDTNQSNQLLRITIAKGEPYYPEISAGKQRFSLRLLKKEIANAPATQMKEDITIKLTRCVL